MIETTFELATDLDYPYLIDAIRKYFAYDGIYFDEVKVPQGLRSLLSNRDLGSAWIARRQGLAIGYAILGFGFDLEFGGRQATLTDLFIDPAYRRGGIAQAFLEHLEHFCRDRGIGAIELQVELDNPEALALYEKRGFKRHTRLPMSKRL